MVKAKKYLGQHFLINQHIVNKILEVFFKCPSFFSIEIGAGTGVLTEKLIQHLEKNNFIAIDIDKESIHYLKQKFTDNAEQFLLEDFLSSDLIGKILLEKKVNIIGNFPYNISSQIMFRVLEYKENVQCVVGMFQKEVAERICAVPGNKSYGILSVLLQTYFEVKYLFTVNEGNFIPPPRVKSSVIILKNKNIIRLSVNEKLYFEVVKTAFQQRRKTLRNSLQKWSKHLSIPFAEKRPEQLSFNDFIELTSVIEKAISG